jgi:hypothetical protein
MKPFYEPRKYWVKVTGQGLGQTSKGNIQFVLSFTVLGAVNPDNPDEYLEEKAQLERRYWRVLNERTIDWGTEDLKTLGFAGDSFAQLDPKHPRHWSLKDQMVMMFCNHTTDQNGELREEWSIARTGPLVQEEAAVDKVRQLDALFAKNLEYLKSGGKTPPESGAASGKKQAGARQAGMKNVSAQVPVHAGSGQEITDDDIPF